MTLLELIKGKGKVLVLKYNKLYEEFRKKIIENIQLPHTLLSRFDLIFLMLDMKTLKDYLAYARAYINPRISEHAGQALIEAYVEMRKVGSRAWFRFHV